MSIHTISQKAELFQKLAEEFSKEQFSAKQLVNIVVYEKLFNVFKDWNKVMDIISDENNIYLHKIISLLGKKVLELNLTSKEEVLDVLGDEIDQILKSKIL